MSHTSFYGSMLFQERTPRKQTQASGSLSTLIVLSMEQVASTQSLYLHQSPHSVSFACAFKISDGAACRVSQIMDVLSPEADKSMFACCGFLHQTGSTLPGMRKHESMTAWVLMSGSGVNNCVSIVPKAFQHGGM